LRSAKPSLISSGVLSLIVVGLFIRKWPSKLDWKASSRQVFRF
jgi:hypothetical protein